MKSTAPQNETGINTTILTIDRKNHITVTITINTRRMERISLILCCMMVNLIFPDNMEVRIFFLLLPFPDRALNTIFQFGKRYRFVKDAKNGIIDCCHPLLNRRRCGEDDDRQIPKCRLGAELF